jgi:hypothetical protein
MYGGGTFLTQNKVLPGAYINFASVAQASSVVSDRGYGALALELDWGPDTGIFTVEQGDFQENASSYFGYDYTADAMKGLRDLFLNLKTGYFYRLNGGGTQASCTVAKAKYSGIRGNAIQIVVAANVDDVTKFDVSTYFDGTLVDKQTAVATIKDLADNDYVSWIDTATLVVTAGTTLTGGTNGTTTGTKHSAFLDALESYSYNVLGCLSTDDTVKSLYLAYTKRMRDDVGAKFQLVGFNFTNPDYEGCINLTTPTTDITWPTSSLVYWVLGAEAGCAVNRSVTNKTYDGEFTPTCDTKASALTADINAGYFVFHSLNDDTIRVLKDINSFVSFTKYKTRDFSLNQDIRVLDQIANDTALLFDKTYLGKIQNDTAGRVDFWG